MLPSLGCVNDAVKIISLQSGSCGNCIYVEAGGVRLLLDAGISGAQAQRRLAQHGRDICSVDAILISHDHADHVRCMGVFQRKFGLPIYCTRKTLAAAARWQSLGRLDDVQHFVAGERLCFGSVCVETIPTPHDAADGVGFVIDDGQRRLGVLTDLGHAFAGLYDLVATLDAVFIESNYDPQMLAAGPYPWLLKQRIRGPGGHLSNGEAASLLGESGHRLQWACLGHLSEENNHPELAVAAHRRALGTKLPLHVASRYEASAELQM
jgi:phosphoribosyl 1,2-cyclic phosphodiesterase